MKNPIIPLLTIIFLLIAIALGAYLLVFSEVQQEITFTNESTYNIESVKIKYSGEETVLSNIQPQSTISEEITVNSDGSFYIKIVFSDSSTIEKNSLGYITKNDGSNNIFLVTENKELEFNQEY